MIYPTALHRRRDLARMGAARNGRRDRDEHARGRAPAAGGIPEARDRPVVAIPNGFDAADFAGPGSRAHRRHVPDRPHGLSAHRAGLAAPAPLPLRQVSAERPRAGHPDPIACLPRRGGRPPARREPALRDVLELHLAGVLTEADREVADRCPVVRLHGYMTHAESIELMRRPSCSSCRCRTSGRECARRSCPARPTSTSRPARRSSRRCLRATPGTSSRRRGMRSSPRR